MISMTFDELKRDDGNSSGAGYTKYEPVMLDMDPFGGKELHCTKYQESGIAVVSTGENTVCSEQLLDLQDRL